MCCVFFVGAFLSGCASEGNDTVSSLEISSGFIKRISKGEKPESFFKNQILLDARERKGFFQVFNAISRPDKFHVSEGCHTEVRFCLGFDYHVNDEELASRMLVGFVLEGEELKISSYSIFLPGTFKK